MSSRFLVFVIPLVVIAVFWLMARREQGQAHDPTHKSFFERNGTVLGLVFILLVAFWTLFLVVLPYLYMVVESFHPKLPPGQARRAGRRADHRAVQVLLRRRPSTESWNTTHLGAFGYHHRHLDHRSRR